MSALFEETLFDSEGRGMAAPFVGRIDKSGGRQSEPQQHLLDRYLGVFTRRGRTTMSATTPEAAKPIRLAVFAATLFLVGVVSIAAQFVAISLFGLAGLVRLEGAYGPGLVAVISAFVMGVKSTTWDTWRRWIWLPIVIAVTVAFIVTGLFAQSIAAQAAAEQERCDILWQQLEAKSAQIGTLKDELEVLQAPSTVPAPSWASDNGSVPAPSWSEEGKKIAELTNAQLEYSRLHDEHLATC